MSFPVPTIRELKKAREAFEEIEPRGIMYRASEELVSKAISKTSRLKIAEALAVLLQTWNQAYYRYNDFDDRHFYEIESLIFRYRRQLSAYRERSIADLRNNDKDNVKNLFKDFEMILGPVGASKSLHLLAPRFFPLWDRSIAKAYGLALRQRGKNYDRYYKFMLITKEQCYRIRRKGFRKHKLLKLLDEYNYCKFTKEWI